MWNPIFRSEIPSLCSTWAASKTAWMLAGFASETTSCAVLHRSGLPPQKNAPNLIVCGVPFPH